MFGNQIDAFAKRAPSAIAEAGEASASADAKDIQLGDVFHRDSYMGRLFIFPTSNPDLNAMGIRSEWFLVSVSGEVASGHVNAAGEWSLSPSSSLAPGGEFSSMEEALEQVSSSLWGEKLTPTLSLAVDSAVSNNFDGDSDDADSVERYDPQVAAFAAAIPRLDVLRELLVGELEQDSEAGVALDEEQVLVQPEEGTIAQVSPKEHLMGLDESDRLQVQNALIDAVVAAYRQGETTEFVLPPFGVVTVHTEAEYFVLRSDSNGHTVLAATLEGEVLDELEAVEAAMFAEVLRQSEVGETRWATVEAVSINAMEESKQKSQGMEYGD